MKTHCKELVDIHQAFDTARQVTKTASDKE